MGSGEASSGPGPRSETPAPEPAPAPPERAAEAQRPPDSPPVIAAGPMGPAEADEGPAAQPGLSQSLRAAAADMLRLADEIDRLVALLGNGVFGALGGGAPAAEGDDGLSRLLAAARRISGGVPDLSSYARLRGLLSQFGRD